LFRETEDFLRAVIGSRAEDWHRVDGGGNTYLDSFVAVTARHDDEEVHWLEHDGHHRRVVFKPNIAIGMAWGIKREPDERFDEEWVRKFPDENAGARAAWLDLLYNGQPVDRRLYVGVDGGRCKISLPGQTFRGDMSAHEVRRWISYGDYRRFAIVPALEGDYDYGD
jgi:hypothetical protein